MGIEINSDPLSFFGKVGALGQQDPITIAIKFFLNGGWVVFLIIVIYILYILWLEARQGKYAAAWEHILLAIDIPKNNEQTPKAVENIFIALAGAQSGGNLIEKYWEGKVQESFSFEIVSIGGYIQFLVRTPTHFRDLVESAVYAQYPDAEITEVADYAQEYAEERFPNEKYNIWGTEMVLYRDYPYPIRTYPEFEHGLSQALLDPMAGLLEIMSRFDEREQVWIQLVVTPQEPGWGEGAKKVIADMQGESYTAPEHALVKAASAPFRWVGAVANAFTEVIAPEMTAAPDESAEDALKMLKMTPGTRLTLENIERKLSRHAFRVKFRLVYLGEQEIFNKAKGVAAVIGAIQQFNTADANGFKPGKKTKTGADYFFVKRRLAKKQNNILKHYVTRDNYTGDDVENMFLNTEELATIWHFPIMTVGAPAVEKIASRKVVSPSRLPMAEREFAVPSSTPAPTAPATPEPAAVAPTRSDTPASPPTGNESDNSGGAPPSNLPIA